MFCEYDYSEFPMVKAKFNGTIKDESDFTLFTQQWIELYNDEKYFTFLFDVKDMGFINPYWSYRVASFISEIKKKPVQYLTGSRIINVNSFVNYLLKIVFSIQSPISTVIIVHNDGSEKIIDP
jgi:hypothetical protein